MSDYPYPALSVVCRGTYTDRETGETVDAHEPRAVHTFGSLPHPDGGFIVLPGNQTVRFPGEDLYIRLAINCACGRGLTTRDIPGVARILIALMGHGASEIDMESLRAYVRA